MLARKIGLSVYMLKISGLHAVQAFYYGRFEDNGVMSSLSKFEIKSIT
jgi:hypothetical protein